MQPGNEAGLSRSPELTEDNVYGRAQPRRVWYMPDSTGDQADFVFVGKSHDYV